MFTVANIVASFNSESGGPPRAIAMIAAASEGVWRAELFTTTGQNSPADKLLHSEFPGQVNIVPDRFRGGLCGLALLVGIHRNFRRRFLMRAAPDVVHIHGMWTPLLAAFAKESRQRGIPYVVAPHGMLEPWSLSVRSRRKALAMKTYQGALLAGASAMHATSELEARNLRLLIGNRTPVFIVPNAIAAPPVTAPMAGPVDGKRELLFLSRIHEKKGLDVLLRVWADMRPADWRLRIVGSGDPGYLSKLRGYCKTHDLLHVEFTPHVEGDGKEAAFSRASAFVLPTFSENFGNVVGEALVRGLPVITTTGTPWSGIVAHRCGWYVEPTFDALRQALAAAMVMDVQSLKRMGERGKKFVAEHFSLPVVRRALIDMYGFALRGSASAPAPDNTAMRTLP